MPLCYIYTNLPAADLKEGLEERIANVLAETLNKPLERIIILIVPGCRIFRRGSSEPTCSIRISAIDVFDKERNPKYGAPIRELIMKELGLTAERVFILYDDIEMSMIG